MAYCPVCGSLETSGQNFCAKCGSPTPATESPSTSASPSPSGTSGIPPYPGTSAYPPAPVYQGEWATQPGIAGFWWRVVAFVLDEVFIDLVLFAALHNLTLITFYEQVAIAAIANFLYFGLMVGLARGQTLGMKICRLRVVNAKDQSPVTFNQAMVRSASYCALLLLSSIYNYHARRSAHMTTRQAEVVLRDGLLYLALAAPHFLDLLWAAWDKRRQTLHDKLAKTVVIRTR